MSKINKLLLATYRRDFTLPEINEYFRTNLNVRSTIEKEPISLNTSSQKKIDPLKEEISKSEQQLKEFLGNILESQEIIYQIEDLIYHIP